MEYSDMSYKELQQLAKEHGIAANKKKAELIELLQATPVVDASAAAEEEHAEVSPLPEEKQEELVAVLESLTISAPAEEEEEKEEDLNTLTVAELKAKAKAMGIEAPKKKADLVAAICAAMASASTPEAPAVSMETTEHSTDVNSTDDVVEDQQLFDFIDRCEFLDFNEQGRVVCALTGHEMKPRFSIVMEHVTGENITQKLKERKAADDALVTKLAGVPSPKGKKKIFNTPEKSRGLEETNVRWTYEDYDRTI